MHTPLQKPVVMIALAVVAVLGLFVAYLAAPQEVGPDYSRTQMTFNRAFVASLTPDDGEPEVGKIGTWMLALHYPDGAPVINAKIAVAGGMLEHSHALPTNPEVTTELGEGRYRVEGMKFSMTGRWVLRFDIVTKSASDTAFFNILL